MSRFVNSSSPATTRQVHASKELTICQESGKAYRPFINPKRIQSNDAKKSLVPHSKGVPDEYLRIIPPTTKLLESGRFEKGETATSPTGSAPGRVIIFDSRPSGRQSPNYNLSTPDVEYTTLSSMQPSSHTPVTSSLATSVSEYPDLAPSDSMKISCPSTYWYPFIAESTYHDAPYSDTATDPVDFGFDLQDPYVLAEALSIARQMNVQARNGDHLCPKHNSSQTRMMESGSDNGPATHRSSYRSKEDTCSNQAVNYETIFAPQPLHASQLPVWSQFNS